jgi:pimeloyl-ACP methyl ester carboxylesterase
MATAAPLRPAAPHRGIRALLARRPLVSFFVLAFAGTWLFELAYVLSEHGVRKGRCFPIERTSASIMGGCFMKKVLLVIAVSAVLLLLLASAAFAQSYKNGGAASASPAATASATASPSATATASATASPSATASAVNSGKSNDFAGLVDIGGGRQMYMECRGTGYPRVVFVSGGQDRTETWSKTLDPSKQAVLPAIAETNRVCAYDRPGTLVATGERPEDFEPSRSDPVPQPTTLQDGVDDLHALLSASGERGPFVVVGHSIGGAIAELYASEYPQDVSGLVLIDYTPYAARTALTDEQWELWKPLLGPVTKEALAIYPDLEHLDNERNLEQALAAVPLKPMPLIVLSADKRYNLTPYAEDGTLPMTVKEAKEFGRILFQAVVDARSDLVSQVPGARHITNTNSDHYIHQEQPQLVIDAVREVLYAVEQQSPSLLTDTGGVPPSVFLLASALLLGTGLLVARWAVRDG